MRNCESRPSGPFLHAPFCMLYLIGRRSDRRPPRPRPRPCGHRRRRRPPRLRRARRAARAQPPRPPRRRAPIPRAAPLSRRAHRPPGPPWRAVSGVHPIAGARCRDHRRTVSRHRRSERQAITDRAIGAPGIPAPAERVRLRIAGGLVVRARPSPFVVDPWSFVVGPSSLVSGRQPRPGVGPRAGRRRAGQRRRQRGVRTMVH